LFRVRGRWYVAASNVARSWLAFLTAENLGVVHEGDLLERRSPGSKVCKTLSEYRGKNAGRNDESRNGSLFSSPSGQSLRFPGL
jgi:hypothetical protein